MQERTSKLIDRVQALKESEAELEKNRLECRELRQQLQFERERNQKLVDRYEHGMSEMIEKGKQMENLCRQLIAERNAVVNRRDEKRVRHQEVQTVALPSHRGIEVSVQAQFAVQEKFCQVPDDSQTLTDIFSPPRNERITFDALSPLSPSLRPTTTLESPALSSLFGAEVSPAFLMACWAAAHLNHPFTFQAAAGSYFVPLCQNGWWRWTLLTPPFQRRVNAYDSDKVGVDWPNILQNAVEQFFHLLPNNGSYVNTTSECIGLLTGHYCYGPFSWSQVDLNVVGEKIRRHLAIAIVSSAAGDEAVITDVVFVGEQLCLNLVTVHRGNVVSQWLHLRDVVNSYDRVFLLEDIDVTCDLRFRTTVRSDGFADIGLSLRNRDLTCNASAFLKVSFINFCSNECYEGCVVPFGENALELMCPSLTTKVFDSCLDSDAIDVICIARFSSDGPRRVEFISKPEQLQSGELRIKQRKIVAQVNKMEAYISNLLAIGENGGENFEVMDAWTNTDFNPKDNTVCDDERFASFQQVAQEMHRLEAEFSSIEGAAFDRAITLLQSQHHVLLQHHREVSSYALFEMERLIQFQRFIPHKEWMENSANLALLHVDRAANEFVAFTDPLIHNIGKRMNQVMVLINLVAPWFHECMEMFLEECHRHAEVFLTHIPTIAVTEVGADLMFPQEDRMLSTIDAYNAHFEEKCEHVFTFAREVVELMIYSNLSFTLHAITVLDERDEKIEDLEERLIKPPTKDATCMALTSIDCKALYQSETNRLKLQLSTYENYVPQLMKERNQVVTEHQALQRELVTSHLQIDSLSDRADALMKECETLSEKLRSNDDTRLAQFLRIQESQGELEALRKELFASRAKITEYENTHYIHLKDEKQRSAEKDNLIGDLRQEILRLKDDLDSAEQNFQKMAEKKKSSSKALKASSSSIDAVPEIAIISGESPLLATTTGTMKLPKNTSLLSAKRSSFNLKR